MQVPTVDWAMAVRWAGDAEIDEAMSGVVSFSGGVKASFDYSFLTGPRGLPETIAHVHGENGSISITNFLLPHIQPGNSLVVRAVSGEVLSAEHVRATGDKTTYALQLAAFVQHVADVRLGRAPPDAFEHTGQRAVRFAALLDDIYIKAGMRPRGLSSAPISDALLPNWASRSMDQQDDSSVVSSFADGGTVEIEAGGAQHQAGHHVLPHAILTYESELATVQQWSSSETWTLVHSERFTVSLHGLAADAMLAGSDAIILRSQRIDGTSFPTEAELQRGIIDPELTCLIKSALLERCLQAAAGHPGLIQQAVETALRRDTDGRATRVKLGGMFAVEKPRTVEKPTSFAGQKGRTARREGGLRMAPGHHEGFPKWPEQLVVGTVVAYEMEAIGAVVLARGLRHHVPVQQLVCLTPAPEALSRDAQLALRNAGWGLRDVTPRIYNPVQGTRFTWAFSKFHYFSLVEYMFILHIDADAMVRRPFDVRAYLDSTHVLGFVASPDIVLMHHSQPRGRLHVQTGVFLIRPNTTQYQHYLAVLNTTVSSDNSEQGMLQTLHGKSTSYLFGPQLPIAMNAVLWWPQQCMLLTPEEQELCAFWRASEPFAPIVHFVESKWNQVHLGKPWTFWGFDAALVPALARGKEADDPRCAPHATQQVDAYTSDESFALLDEWLDQLCGPIEATQASPLSEFEVLSYTGGFSHVAASRRWTLILDNSSYTADPAMVAGALKEIMNHPGGDERVDVIILKATKLDGTIFPTISELHGGQIPPDLVWLARSRFLQQQQQQQQHGQRAEEPFSLRSITAQALRAASNAQSLRIYEKSCATQLHSTADDALVGNHPCTGDMASVGSNTYRQLPLQLADASGVRAFSSIIAERYSEEGILLVQNRAPEELALLRDIAERLSEATHTLRDETAQPNRIKHRFPTSALHTPPRGTRADIEQGLVATSMLRRLQSVFFLAFHLLLPSPDYATHGQLDPSTDYLDKVLDIATLEIMGNENQPGSTFQNPHWDYPKQVQGFLFIEVPLTEVAPGGGPLEVWPGTHLLLYNETFDHPNAILRNSGSEERQYTKCFHEMLVAARKRPSMLVYSSLGDIIVRNPWTWHRGTPNRQAHTRHILTFIFRRHHV